MKTIREYIDLIETAQNPVDDDVEHLANVAADAYWSGKFGMTSATEKVKMARDIVQAVEDGRLSIEELRQDIRDLDKPGVAEGSEQGAHVKYNQGYNDAKNSKPSIHKTLIGNDRHNYVMGYKDGQTDRKKPKEQGMAEGENQATRTCPTCDGSGEDTLDPTESCRRCGGKGHVPVPKPSPREQEAAKWGRKSSVYPFSR